ncbi:glucose-1-phosphate thymidylyltransferase [Candidatus Termititenax persephonae]|uniref:Glucose-1-phosphate thymidylyltransferase n=1 Tax=Candidatus Termititenax persephonae TaxID=2218525 RepID=A0A388TGJ6_9BACT|nr:glucose-1-phosphate thymidylyltransferase [Candidatus Termititenax persephonae]
MINNIFIFEDEKYSNFLPLTQMRPVYDLICGISPLIAKIVRQLPEANISLHCRGHLKNIVKQNHTGIGVNHLNTGLGCLIVNGRLLPSEKFCANLLLDGRDRLFISQDDEIIAGYLNTDNLYELRDILDDTLSSHKIINTFRNRTEISHINEKLIEYPWDILNACSGQIVRDFQDAVPMGIVKGDVHVNATVLDEYKLYVGDGARILPGVTLDCEKGPVYIGDHCLIKPHTYIEGPAYIGKFSEIANSRILAGSSIGPNSVINNSETSNSILHGYSSLDHNCLRSSYLADCVNLQSQTFTQDLLDLFNKEPTFHLPGAEVESDEKRLGLICGDFASVGAQINIPAGSSLGVASRLTADHSTAPRYTPCFIQQNGDAFEEMSIKETLDILEYTLGLKEVELTAVEKDLIETIHDFLGSERKVSKIIY